MACCKKTEVQPEVLWRLWCVGSGTSEISSNYATKSGLCQELPWLCYCSEQRKGTTDVFWANGETRRRSLTLTEREGTGLTTGQLDMPP